MPSLESVAVSMEQFYHIVVEGLKQYVPNAHHMQEDDAVGKVEMDENSTETTSSRDMKPNTGSSSLQSQEVQNDLNLDELEITVKVIQ